MTPQIDSRELNDMFPQWVQLTAAGLGIALMLLMIFWPRVVRAARALRDWWTDTGEG
jgi:hypothetical protein